jgi:PqqD family protein of HPr-rel-A system
MGAQNPYYKAEPASGRIVMPLDVMTLIYQRSSGMTHIVAEPVPEILDVMGDDACDPALVAARLATRFDLGDETQAKAIIAERLHELATLGLVERIDV